MIKDLSTRRRLPRAGVIRLGIKVKKPGGSEYPKETDYFVCPEIVKDFYGPEPKELLVMFPVESEQVFFQQFYKKYGNGVLLCRGDGEVATYYDFDSKGFTDKKCPCESIEKKECKQVAILQFLLPEIKEAIGVFQISTSSTNSIVDINSGVDLVRSIAGRVRMIPLILKREETNTQKIEEGKVIKGKHYTMKLSFGMSLMEIQKLGQVDPTMVLLPRPDETIEAIDDIFPENGFEPTKELEEPASTMEAIKEESDLLKLKKELSDILEKIKESGREITKDEVLRLDSIKTTGEYKGAIRYWKNELDTIGDDDIPVDSPSGDLPF